jgi:hypothetical protein
VYTLASVTTTPGLAATTIAFGATVDEVVLDEVVLDEVVLDEVELVATTLVVKVINEDRNPLIAVPILLTGPFACWIITR